MSNQSSATIVSISHDNALTKRKEEYDEIYTSRKQKRIAISKKMYFRPFQMMIMSPERNKLNEEEKIHCYLTPKRREETIKTKSSNYTDDSQNLKRQWKEIKKSGNIIKKKKK